MYLLIGTDGKEYGPVDAETVKDWVSRNLANHRTLVRRADEEPPSRKALADFPEFADVAALPPALPSAPPPPPDEPPRPAGSLHTPIPINVNACIEEALRTARPVRIFRSVEHAWSLAGSDYWPMFGVSAIVLFILTSIGMVPYVGPWIQSVLQGILLGGLVYYFLGKKRGLPRRFDDAFIGLQRMTLNLFLVSFVGGLLATLATLPGVVLIVGGAILTGFKAEHLRDLAHAAGNPESVGSASSLSSSSLAADPLAIGLLVAGALLAVGAALYFSIAWRFALNLVIDRRIGFWNALSISRAVVSRQWWRVFGLSLVEGLLAMGGLLLCCVGFLFVLPVLYCIEVYVYDDLFGGMRTRGHDES